MKNSALDDYTDKSPALPPINQIEHASQLSQMKSNQKEENSKFERSLSETLNENEESKIKDFSDDESLNSNEN